MTINREVGWHTFDLRGVFAAFLEHFQHLTSSVRASQPLNQRKIAKLGCQEFRNREVGWQKGPWESVMQFPFPRWNRIERSAGRK
jgi:hypothetical protein